MFPKPQSKFGRIVAQFLVGAVLIALFHAAAAGQQDAKKKKSEIEKEKRSEALKKMAEARGDIQFYGRTIKQPQFKKMCKPATAEQLGNLKEKSPVVIVGMPVRKAGDNWIIATKKGASGWDAGLIAVAGDFRGKFIDGELAAVYGEQIKIGNEWALKAYLVDKPAGDDLGLVFQYKVLGQKAAAADQVQTWTVIGEVSNTTARDFSFVQVEARMDSAGDSDVWSDFVRVLPAKSKKPFSIKLIGLQFSSQAVSQPKVSVYIKDFSD